MNFHWYYRDGIYMLAVEAKFSLLDFIFLFASFLLGLMLYGFFLAFTVGYIAKIFSRSEFEFDITQKKLRKYVNIFGSLRIKTGSYAFSEIRHILYTNYDWGNPFWPVNWTKEQSYSVVAECDNSRVLISKVQEEDKENTDLLFEGIGNRLKGYISLTSEFLNE